LKCKKSAGECLLEVKFFENGNVLEYCIVCEFEYLHEAKNIKDNYLNPYIKKEE